MLACSDTHVTIVSRDRLHYTEKIQLPKKVLPESAKKFMANNIIESFETQNKKTCSNINNIYLMGFLLVLLLLGLLFNNYFI